MYFVIPNDVADKQQLVPTEFWEGFFLEKNKNALKKYRLKIIIYEVFFILFIWIFNRN
jgi:hypothetical protein